MSEGQVQTEDSHEGTQKPEKQVLRRHSNGKVLLEEVKTQPREGGLLITLKASDSYERLVFGFQLFSPETNVIEGEYDGWLYNITERKDDLPLVIEKTKVAKGFGDLMSETLGKRLAQEFDLPEPEEKEVEEIRQQVHYVYDEVGRPVKKTVFQKVIFNDQSPFPNKELLFPIGESEYHYDELGRLRVAANYRYDDGRDKSLESAELYSYEDISEDRVRIAMVAYGNVGWKDLSNGGYPSRLLIKDVNPKTSETVAYAVYKDERRTKGILTNYDFVKRHPKEITFYREIPGEGMNWVNWQSQPEEFRVASYITERGIKEFVKGAGFLEIGSDPTKENKFEVLYFDEFMKRVLWASDDEALQIASGLLTGKIDVPMFGPDTFTGTQEEIDKKLLRVMQSANLMTEAQKMALIAHWLPGVARVTRDGFYKNLNDIKENISSFTNLLAQSKKENRAAFIQHYRNQHPNLQEEIGLVLDVLENPENFPEMILSNPERFTEILE